MNCFVRKPTICIGEHKDADQLCGNREADQRLCFRYMDSTLTLLLKSKILSFKPVSVTAQTGLCWTCSETTLLMVFPRGGSKFLSNLQFLFYKVYEVLKMSMLQLYGDQNDRNDVLFQNADRELTQSTTF